jgi:hypothetical protein
VIDERIALPKERAPEQYVAWGHHGYLKLFPMNYSPRRHAVNPADAGVLVLLHICVVILSYTDSRTLV